MTYSDKMKDVIIPQPGYVRPLSSTCEVQHYTPQEHEIVLEKFNNFLVDNRSWPVSSLRPGQPCTINLKLIPDQRDFLRSKGPLKYTIAAIAYGISRLVPNPDLSILPKPDPITLVAVQVESTQEVRESLKLIALSTVGKADISALLRAIADSALLVELVYPGYEFRDRVAKKDE